MKLNEKQKTILCAAHLDVDKGYSHISRLSGYSPTVVRNTLLRLESLGIIYKRPIIDYGLLGYHYVQIYFSFFSTDLNAEEVLTKTIVEENRIAVAYSLGGKYQYGLLLLIQDLSEVSNFLDRLQQLSNILITDKEVSVVLSSLIFRRDYLSNLSEGKREICDRTPCQFSDSSDLEKKIVRGLSQLKYSSKRDLARQLSIAQSTFEFTLAKLVSKGIHKGMVYSLREREINLHQYRLLIYGRGGGGDLKKQLLEISRSNPNVIEFSECLGAIDYEIEIETEDPKIAVNLRNEIIGRLGDRVASTQLHQLFQYYKASNRVVYE